MPWPVNLILAQQRTATATASDKASGIWRQLPATNSDRSPAKCGLLRQRSRQLRRHAG